MTSGIFFTCYHKGRNCIFSVWKFFITDVGNSQVSIAEKINVTRDLNGTVTHTCLNMPKYDFVPRLNL